jgi:hypothetical protein
MKRSKRQLEKPPQFPVTIDSSHPFKMYLAKGKLYVDVELYGSPDRPTIMVKQGIPMAIGPDVIGVYGDQ